MGLHGQETALPDLLVGEWSGGYLGQKQWWFTFRRDGTYDYVRSVNTQCAIAHSGRAILVGELLTLEPETITEQGSLPCRKSIEQENHLVHVKKTYAVGRRVSDGPNVLLFYEPGTGGPGVKSNFWVLRRGH